MHTTVIPATDSYTEEVTLDTFLCQHWALLHVTWHLAADGTFTYGWHTTIDGGEILHDAGWTTFPLSGVHDAASMTAAFAYVKHVTREATLHHLARRYYGPEA